MIMSIIYHGVNLHHDDKTNKNYLHCLHSKSLICWKMSLIEKNKKKAKDEKWRKNHSNMLVSKLKDIENNNKIKQCHITSILTTTDMSCAHIHTIIKVSTLENSLWFFDNDWSWHAKFTLHNVKSLVHYFL